MILCQRWTKAGVHPRDHKATPQPLSQGRKGRVRRTFWEETTVPVDEMFTQEPSVAKLIIPLDQFDSIALSQGQFVGASGSKVIYRGTISQPLGWKAVAC